MQLCFFCLFVCFNHMLPAKFNSRLRSRCSWSLQHRVHSGGVDSGSMWSLLLGSYLGLPHHTQAGHWGISVEDLKIQKEV